MALLRSFGHFGDLALEIVQVHVSLLSILAVTAMLTPVLRHVVNITALLYPAPP